MEYQYINFEQSGSVGKITLNRPEVLNSFNRQMSVEFLDCLDYCEKDKSIRCLLITGEGRAFSAGQDLSEVIDSSLDLGEIVKNVYNPIILKLRSIEKPVICAVNGTAAGAGANIALACDIVIASRDASFVQVFSKIGLIPDSGGTYFLPRLIGLPRATALAFLGDKVSADKAVEYGMIYQSIEPDELEKTSMEMASKLASMPTTGLGLTKRGLNASPRNSLINQLDYEEQLQSLAGKTNDYKEGVNAFLEKRKPNFTGD